MTAAGPASSGCTGKAVYYRAFAAILGRFSFLAVSQVSIKRFSPGVGGLDMMDGCCGGYREDNV